MTKPRGRLVCAGAATLDAIAAVRELPAEDERVLAECLEYAGGGPAATAAVAASRLGVPTSFVGAVGRDDEGERILRGLADEGVDVSGVERSVDRRSGASIVIVQADSGARRICTRPVPSFSLPEDSTAWDVVHSADWVHVDHLGWQPVSRSIADLPAGQRPALSVDAGNPIEGFTPDGVDLFVPTVRELRRTYGERSDEELLDAALAAGARTVVATRGAEGCVAADAAGGRASMPGYPVDVVSTLGAGDVFHGALVAAVARGEELLPALTYAAAAAALSCRGLDGRSAVPTHDQVVQALDQPTV